MRESAGWLRVIHGSSCDAAGLERIVRSELGAAGVLRIVGAPARGPALAYWGQVGAACKGPIDAWSEVSSPADRMDLFGRGPVADPLHTLDAWTGADGGVALFYLERQGRTAGDNLFIDAGTVSACARRLRPKLYDRLYGTPVRFGRSTDPGPAAPILRREGDRLKIRWDYYRVTPEQGEAVESLRADFRAFLDDLVLSGDVASQRLETGDALFVAMDEVLVGRAAGAKPSGDRIMWRTSLGVQARRETRAA